jgi:ABC-type branched-subunit amino acid transport system ATPase component
MKLRLREQEKLLIFCAVEIAQCLRARGLKLYNRPSEGMPPSVLGHIGRALSRIPIDLKIAVLLVEQYLKFAWSIADRYYVMQGDGHSGDTSQSPDAIEQLVSF